MDSAGDRRPAGCKVPCGCRSAGSCTRDLGHGGAGQQKVGKVAGSHGEVSRAHGEEGTQAGYLRESRRLWLAPLCDAARRRCRDQASPRGPAPAAAAARRAGRPASVRLSVPPGRSAAPGSRRRGGAGPAARPPPHWSQLRTPPRFGLPAGAPRAESAALCRGRLLAAGVRPRGRRTVGWTERRPRGARAPAQTQVQSHPWSCAPSPGGEPERAPRLPPASPPGLGAP